MRLKHEKLNFNNHMNAADPNTLSLLDPKGAVTGDL